MITDVGERWRNSLLVMSLMPGSFKYGSPTPITQTQTAVTTDPRQRRNKATGGGFMGIRTQNAYNVCEVTTMDFPFSTGDYQGSDVQDGFSPANVDKLSESLNALLADCFALYLKTKNFHWHMTGPHFRDWHLMLDEQAAQIYGITDDIAERVRKIGGTTIKSIGQIARLQRIQDSDEPGPAPKMMLKELLADNRTLIIQLRSAHTVCALADDYASTAMIEVWIDEAERRAWFLFEATR